MQSKEDYMSELKIFRISGFYKKAKRKIPINMDVRALKEEDALETMYSVIGSKHLVRRSDIFIPKEGGITVLENADIARTREFADIDEEGFVIPR